MATRKFVFLDKQKLHLFLLDLFEILHSNMDLIAPTGNTYNEDWEIWSSHIIPAMKCKQREIVLMYFDNTLAGYFQYHVDIDKNSFMMEEIQIKKEFQGTGLFSSFYRWLVKRLPKNIRYVEAYANKVNYKSQDVLKHLGLVEAGENKNGNSFYYKGEYSILLSRYI